jgi:uncharacterized protein HemY
MEILTCNLSVFVTQQLSSELGDVHVWTDGDTLSVSTLACVSLLVSATRLLTLSFWVVRGNFEAATQFGYKERRKILISSKYTY